MRIRYLEIAGFRGFNQARKIKFDARLTVVSAPNSHGKTSITEALELLFYGQTSKVASADSKDEYKDSYRNRHFPADEVAYIEAACAFDDGSERTFRVDVHDGRLDRSVDGEPAAEWPFQDELADAARPFVVQHALKRLLLAAPADRFRGFAHLLGLHRVGGVQQALVNLCTKPDSHLPPEAKALCDELDVFVARLKAIKETARAGRALAKGTSGFNNAFEKLEQRAQKLVGDPLSGSPLAMSLVQLRNASAGKVYSGSVRVGELSTPDQGRVSTSLHRLKSFVSEGTVTDYGQLAAGGTIDSLRRQFNLLGLGLSELHDTPDVCPLCHQELDQQLRNGIESRHGDLEEHLANKPDLARARTEFTTRLQQLSSDATTHASLLRSRATDLINANTPENSEKIKSLIGEGHEHELFLIAGAGAALSPRHNALDQAKTEIELGTTVCAEAINQKSEDLSQIERLIEKVGEYLSAAHDYEAKVAEVEPTLRAPSQVLQAAVDAEAGTVELSLLIEVLGRRREIEKAARFRDLLDSLKALRKHVDQAVGETMEQAFSSELTDAVMGWYEQIRTTGDPDVHFSGFAMERTKTGKFKSRRVRVAAHSYGVELASAVSSLSESKLNALGLCISIATTLGSPGPWDFIVLDDPIQSWDDDHEVQFVDVIRRLVEQENRQVILMSHRDGWADQVVEGCRSLNGMRYHIAGYSQEGPVITHREWAGVDQRLREALDIANDPSASPVRLQQAEEELRIVASQLAASAAGTFLCRQVGANNLNSARVRSILTESGCSAPLIDRVVSTFNTTDDAHHAPKGYEPNRERVRQYHGALSELRSWIRKSG